MSWIVDRLREKNSQVAISAAVAATLTALAGAGYIPVWAVPLLTLWGHALQVIFTPDAVTEAPTMPAFPVTTAIPGQE